MNVDIELEFRSDLPNIPTVAPVKLQHLTSFLPTGETKVHTMRIPRKMAEAVGLCKPKS